MNSIELLSEMTLGKNFYDYEDTYLCHSLHVSSIQKLLMDLLLLSTRDKLCVKPFL